ncbi:MAG: hypothetical protein AB8E82_18960 [Aureispira sp.]
MEEQIFGNLALAWCEEDIISVRQINTVEFQDDVEAARQGIAGLIKFAEGPTRKGLLALLPPLYQKKEVLKLFQKADFNEAGVALIVKSFAGKIVGNMFVKIAQKPNDHGRVTPTKLFMDEAKAISWLREQIALSETNTQE